MIISITRRGLTGANGTPYTPVNPVQGLKDNKVTMRRSDETGAIVFGYSSELVFTGVDADELKEWLVDDTNAFTNYYDVTLTDECCGRAFSFILKSNNIDWCETTCEITAQLTEYTPDTRAYDCVNSTLIFDDYAGFKSLTHPRFPYCIELRPRMIHDIILLLVSVVALLGLILIPVVAVVSILIASVCYIINILNWIIDTLNLVINLIPGVSNIPNIPGCSVSWQNPTYLINQYQNIMTRIENYAIGCGRLHPAPLVRAYIDNVCGKCGISFQSTILNDPNYHNADYYNMVLFQAPCKNGLDDNSAQYWQEANRPIQSGAQLLDELKMVFNAEWRIVNNVLIFERHDWFNSTTPWLQTSQLPEANIIKQCYRWTAIERPSYLDFQYSKDGVDWVGNEAIDRYNCVEEWNSPYSPLQKGSLDVVLPYAPARFRNDGITDDFLTDYSWIPWLSSAINTYEHALLMNEGKSFTSKLMIWNPNSGVNMAFVQHNYGGMSFTFAGPDQLYNYPLWCFPAYPGNLYDRFWAIENPRNSVFKGYELDLELLLTCDIVTNASIDNPIEILVNGVAQLVKVKEIEINYNDHIVNIKGEF